MKRKVKRTKLLSLILSIAVLISTVASMGIITNATLLPVEEASVYAELSGYSDEELKDFRVGDLIDHLRYSRSDSKHNYGDPVEVDPDAKVVQLTSGSTVVMGLDESINLFDSIYYYPESDSFTISNMELIIGSGNQLDMNNVIYNISVTVNRKYKSNVGITLLQKDENSEITEWNPVDSDSHTSYTTYSSADGSIKMPVRYFYYYFYDLDLTDKYLSINPYLTNLYNYTTENADVEVYTWSEYRKILQGESAEPVTSEVLSENGIEANSYNDYVLMYYADGNLVYVEEIYIYIQEKTISFYPYFRHAENGKNYYRYDSSTRIATDQYGEIHENSFTFRNTDGSNLSIDDEFFIMLDIDDYTFGNNGVQKIVKGHYNTMEEAAEQEDIKNQLLYKYDAYTYKTTFNGEGAKFTVFLKDPNITGTDSDNEENDVEENEEENILSYRLTFALTNIVKVESSKTNMSVPVISGRDPWFNVNGVSKVVIKEDEPVEETTTTPEETTTTPEESTTTPEETTTAPEETTTTPEETTTTPEESTTTPEETTTTPEESTTTPEETTTTPEESTTTSEEATTTPEESTTTPEETSANSEEPSENSYVTSSTDDEDPTASEDTAKPMADDEEETGVEYAPLSTYVIRYSSYDTYYSLGYQTLFVNDIEADMSQLRLNVDGDSRDKMYLSVPGQLINFDEDLQNFEDSETVQYSVSSGSKVKNYFVTVVQKQEKAKLFVNGPEERTVDFNSYFNYRHDIIIANIGGTPLTGLNAYLENAQNVKLDQYWTVGGEGNDTLNPFTETASDKIDSIAKIRLLPDGDGDVSGTLVITADGQNPVRIKLTGHAGDPKIVNDAELIDAVKYVPYSTIIATDNLYDWNVPSYRVSGVLPKGVAINPSTGEIYGVPQEEGTFEFYVYVNFSSFGYASKRFSLNVKENTNENVYLETSEDYQIISHIGQETDQYNYVLENTSTDQLFVSNGSFDEFIDFWFNGQKLTRDQDYTVESGSTRITIKSQTLKDLASSDGANTIAAEFRVDGDTNNDLKRTAQNFVIGNLDDNNNENGNNGSITGSFVTGEDNNQGENDSSGENNDVGNNNGSDSTPDVNADNVQKVIDLINDLPENPTDNDKAAVDEARTEYDRLTEGEKQKVTNYSKLTDAEKALEALKENTASVTPADSGNDSDNSNNSTNGVAFIGILTNSDGSYAAGVNVEIHSEVKTAKTDTLGTFKMSNVEFGDHKITITDDNGNVLAEKQFSIVEGNQTSINGSAITAKNGSEITVRMTIGNGGLDFTEVTSGGVRDLAPNTSNEFPMVLIYIALISLACISGLNIFRIIKTGLR